VLLAHGSPAKAGEAVNRLENLKKIYSETYNTPQLLEVSVLLAAGCSMISEKNKAVEYLEYALTLAEKGYFIRPFMETINLIKPLLSLVNTESRILSTIMSTNSPAQKNIRLSNRELDVLYLLAERKPNKEIAGELYISPATVKKHALSIYKKLGVTKRGEAVTAAREAGIL
jgi:LuxR family maltose regulon positive regulatory protein